MSRDQRDSKQVRDQLMDALRRTFRPEFLNRIDEIVVFRALSREDIEKIVDIQIKDLQKRLAERKITIELTSEAKKVLAERGYDPIFGARPLKRTIQRMVENPLALEILAGKFKEGDQIVVDLARDRETFTFRKEAAVAQPA
jgi:ATP-dependent Clp protease ATP-binding subunit ClpA